MEIAQSSRINLREVAVGQLPGKHPACALGESTLVPREPAPEEEVGLVRDAEHGDDEQYDQIPTSRNRQSEAARGTQTSGPCRCDRFLNELP